jgi:protein phosphatase PTC7
MIIDSFVVGQPRLKNRYYYKPDECGEDSYFNYKIGSKILAMGVADGVGSWKNLNIDPALFSRALMLNAHEIINDYYYNNKKIDSQKIMNLAYENLKQDDRKIYGSATFCSVSFIYEKDKILAKTINLGDSGYIIIRNFKLLHQSKPQRVINSRHQNCPYQIANIPPDLVYKCGTGNCVNDANIENHILKENDFLIFASDGFWDFVDINRLLIILEKNKNISLCNLSTLLLSIFIREYALDDTTFIIAKVVEENIQFM